MNMNRLLSARGGHKVWLWVVALLVVPSGCQHETTETDSSIAAYRDRMLVRHQEEQAARSAQEDTTPRARPVAAQDYLPEQAALLAQPATTTQPAPETVLAELPDPVAAAQVFEERLEKLRGAQVAQQDERVVLNYTKVKAHAVEYLGELARPKQIELGLSECVQRAIENNYTIRYEAHNPAISATQIVEAEAAFDVEFYLDTSWAKTDQAKRRHDFTTINEADSRRIEGGFRKLLPTGTRASVGVNQQRSMAKLSEKTSEWNPTYNTNFVVGLQQPLLRGFGLDVNRAQINLRKVEHDISYETFIQQVRDTLVNVETAYWQLVAARRSVAVSAESLAQNYVTYLNMIERRGHDATEVEVANSESRFASQRVLYLQKIKLVRDAEDQLKNLLNDPTLTLSEDVEIIPTEVPAVAPTAFDQLAEVRTALDHRSEIRAARQRIEASRISTTVAKNGILPQLDLSFQYEVHGLGPSADASFDNVTTNRFVSYTLAANFSYNFGERAARAQYRRARLQESQAMVLLNQITDGIVTEVNERIRTLLVRYAQVPPSLQSVKAAERNLRSLQARAQQINPSYLQTELSAVEQLASTRETLLQVITEYNIGRINLEKAKGTLLDYNNVTITNGPDAR